MPGHSPSMTPAPMTSEVAVGFAGERPARVQVVIPPFEAVYEHYFDFVWRSVRRLGLRDAAVDDAVQETFMVIHRRLASFEGRSSLRTWIFGIALRVVQGQRRSIRRKREVEPLRESQAGPAPSPSPHDEVAKREAVAVLHGFLDELDDDKRAVFILAELEQMSVPEIAAALGEKANTIYSRLRLAREAFNKAVARHRARESFRTDGAPAGDAVTMTKSDAEGRHR